MHEHVRVCVLACLLFFCFVHLWGGQIIAERVYEVRIWFSHICWVWVACCLTRLSVSYDKYAIQSRNKMWLLSFRDITVKSYSTENLNMSREKASSSEAAEERPMFSLSVFEVWVGWGFVYNEKDNNGMMILFSFHPVRRSAQQDFGYGRISMHLISQFSEMRCACALSVLDSFVCEIVMCKKNAKWNRIGALWQICTYQHRSSNKTGSVDVYQTLGCIFLSCLLFVW